MRQMQRLQKLNLAVAVTILTVIACYLIRPELLNPRVAFSSLGAYPPTSYIFTLGFVLAGALVAWDAATTKNIFQKTCRLVAAVGFLMLGLFQIEHGQLRGDLHRLGGLIMMLAVLASILGHVISGWNKSSLSRKLLFSLFACLAIISLVMSILSSSQFEVMAWQGLAQYIGLLSLIGWAMLDSYNS